MGRHDQKPKSLPKEGIMIVSNLFNTTIFGNIFKVDKIFEHEGQKMVTLSAKQENGTVEIYTPFPVRYFVQNIRNKTWVIIKDGPVEPEKILKQFKFI